MSHRFVVVDVFTDRALTGNQLTVFPDAGALPDALLQPLAREINFSETVFAYPPAANGDVRIRIFTPFAELPFAGHQVLGSAFVLASEPQTITLETGKGVVPVTLTHDGGRITSGRMVQPIPTWAPFDTVEELLSGLGVEASELPVDIYDVGARHVMVGLPSAAAVDALRPDLAALATLDTVGVDCFAGAGRSWPCRVFAPGSGVPEDPATGSAAGPLAVHLARHGRTAFGDEIEIVQGVAMGRPSRLLARAIGSPDAVERVEVAGSAVIVGEGTFSL